MSKKILQVVKTAYRATIEEQDDPVLWLSHVLKDLGSDVDVLLRGLAVNYAVTEQDAAGLSIGAWKQTHPPQLEKDLQTLISKGCSVYLLQEDAARLGLEQRDLILGLKTSSYKELPDLYANYDFIWAW